MTSIYHDSNDDFSTSHVSELSTSPATRAISFIKKREPLLIIVTGSYEWNSPIETLSYDSDSQLHLWLSKLLDLGVIILETSDEKIGKVLVDCERLHFHLFKLTDIPAHKTSGLARSLTASLDTLNPQDIERIYSYLTADVISSTTLATDEPLDEDRSEYTSSPQTSDAVISDDMEGLL